MFSFDGSSKIIQINPTVYEFDMKDLYSAWKVWVKTDDNAKFAAAFEAVGGQTIIGNNIITPYFYLINNWKIRPSQEDHVLNISGNILTDNGTDPFIDVSGNYQIRIQNVLALRAESIVSNSAVSPISNSEMDEIADRVWRKSTEENYPEGTFGYFVRKRLMSVTKYFSFKNNQ